MFFDIIRCEAVATFFYLIYRPRRGLEEELSVETVLVWLLIGATFGVVRSLINGWQWTENIFFAEIFGFIGGMAYLILTKPPADGLSGGALLSVGAGAAGVTAFLFLVDWIISKMVLRDN